MPEPHWLEVCYWGSQIVLTVIVGVTAYFAGRQLWLIRESNSETFRLAKASFLLDLDKRWDSHEMTKARQLFIQIREDVSKIVAANNPLMGDRQRGVEAREQFATTLRQMRDQDADNYQALLRMCGFFETTGLMVKSGYISKEDVIALFEGPIVNLDMFFRGHIEERQNETGVPTGFFEHALYLCDLVNQNP